ncbi:hypothetical protein ATCC90586_001410 [Pythium insidiosum]|nr:hypothetical protein ATCC90586_001410 [Pythium insidiosum]
MPSFLEEKVKKPVVALLKSGASPESIALAMAFGVSGGIFPIPGLTTLPVMAAVMIFRLNPVAAMLTNYLCTPLNIATVPVYIMYGNSFFGSGEGVKDFSVSAFMEDVKADTINTLLLFRFTLFNAILLWFASVPIITGLLYAILVPILKRVMPKSQGMATKQHKLH